MHWNLLCSFSKKAIETTPSSSSTTHNLCKINWIIWSTFQNYVRKPFVFGSKQSFSWDKKAESIKKIIVPLCSFCGIVSVSIKQKENFLSVFWHWNIFWSLCFTAWFAKSTCSPKDNHTTLMTASFHHVCGSFYSTFSGRLDVFGQLDIFWAIEFPSVLLLLDFPLCAQTKLWVPLLT